MTNLTTTSAFATERIEMYHALEQFKTGKLSDKLIDVYCIINKVKNFIHKFTGRRLSYV